jgi:hypothetical protein
MAAGLLERRHPRGVRISSEYALPMPLNKCGSVSARFEVWLSRRSARQTSDIRSRSLEPAGIVLRERLDTLHQDAVTPAVSIPLP